MRSGARPIAIWALMLTTSGVVNLIWAGVSIQTVTFGTAVLAIVIIVAAVLLWPRRRGPQAITHASFAAMIIAVGFAALMFGFTFGHFFIYFGAGLMLAGIGRLLVELNNQRRAQGSR